MIYRNITISFTTSRTDRGFTTYIKGSKHFKNRHGKHQKSEYTNVLNCPDRNIHSLRKLDYCIYLIVVFRADLVEQQELRFPSENMT